MLKSILLVTDDKATVAAITGSLGGGYGIKESSEIDKALKAISEGPFDLVILDADLKDKGGLDAYKMLRRVSPRAKVIMISFSNDISMAVSATKLGVRDFLRKPLESDRLKDAVQRNLSSQYISQPLFTDEEEGVEWLSGTSERLKELIRDAEGAAEAESDIVFISEPGIDIMSLARAVHKASHNSSRKFVPINITSFGKESSEPLFWSTIQELLEDRVGSVAEEELPGEIFLGGAGQVSEQFLLSILEFLRKRKGSQTLGRVDKSIRIAISVDDPARLAVLESKGFLNDFSRLEVPSLRDRMEDIPALLDRYMKKFSSTYSKKVSAISSEALRFLSSYDWPGNFRELEAFVALAVLNCRGQVLGISDLPISFTAASREHLNSLSAYGMVSLSKLREGFEKKLYSFVLESVDDDTDDAARFLDIPREVFLKRMNELGVVLRR